MFTRVLVANRGEIAVRVIRTLHELGIEAVAIYSTADSDSLHVRMADHAVCVGPPAAVDSYLRIPSVVAAAETTGCQAVHPGYGFLAENPAFVSACADNDLVFVGPPADVMATMGDKIAAKQAMRAADVPTVPGTEGRDLDLRCAERSRRDRVPGPAQGERRRRRQGDAARQRTRGPRGRVRDGRGRGRGGIRRLDAVRRAGTRPGAPRRDPGALRRPRRRAHARRARMLDPAPAPEADRGVALRCVDARAPLGDGVGGRARLSRGRLPQRRHLRVPARSGRELLLHRAERAAAGRASRHRARHRHRHRPRTAPHRLRESDSRRPAARRARAMRSRYGSTPRIRTRTFALPRGSSRRSGRRSAPGCASTPSSSPDRRSRRTTTR